MKLSRELRIFLLGVGACALLAVLVTVTVTLASRKPAPPAEAAPDLAASAGLVDFSDLAFPDDYVALWRARWYPSRPRLSSWTWDQVQSFWRDPRQSALRSISDQNDEKVRALLAGVP